MISKAHTGVYPLQAASLIMFMLALKISSISFARELNILAHQLSSISFAREWNILARSVKVHELNYRTNQRTKLTNFIDESRRITEESKSQNVEIEDEK